MDGSETFMQSWTAQSPRPPSSNSPTWTSHRVNFALHDFIQSAMVHCHHSVICRGGLLISANGQGQHASVQGPESWLAKWSSHTGMSETLRAFGASALFGLARHSCPRFEHRQPPAALSCAFHQSRDRAASMLKCSVLVVQSSQRRTPRVRYHRSNFVRTVQRSTGADSSREPLDL